MGIQGPPGGAVAETFPISGSIDPKAFPFLLMDLHREENTILVLVTHSLELARRFPRQAELVDGILVIEENRVGAR